MAYPWELRRRNIILNPWDNLLAFNSDIHIYRTLWVIKFKFGSYAAEPETIDTDVMVALKRQAKNFYNTSISDADTFTHSFSTYYII